MFSSEPLPRFIDDYLAYLHEACPTAATFDGWEGKPLPADLRPVVVGFFDKHLK